MRKLTAFYVFGLLFLILSCKDYQSGEGQTIAVTINYSGTTLKALNVEYGSTQKGDIDGTQLIVSPVFPVTITIDSWRLDSNYMIAAYIGNNLNEPDAVGQVYIDASQVDQSYDAEFDLFGVPESDSYEPDNTLATASILTVNTVQVRTLNIYSDDDIMKVTVPAGNVYNIETVIPTGQGTDTTLILYREDGTLLDSSYDIIPYDDLASKITFYAYYEDYIIKVKPSSGYGLGEYSISITAAP